MQTCLLICLPRRRAGLRGSWRQYGKRVSVLGRAESDRINSHIVPSDEVYPQRNFLHGLVDTEYAFARPRQDDVCRLVEALELALRGRECQSAYMLAVRVANHWPTTMTLPSWVTTRTCSVIITGVYEHSIPFPVWLLLTVNVASQTRHCKCCRQVSPLQTF